MLRPSSSRASGHREWGSVSSPEHGLVVLDEEPTDPSVGCSPDRRSLGQLLEYGLITLDKPPGPTSHEVVAWVRRILGVQKAGHSGTLDPPVTGLLPIGVGEATKALSVLLLGAKEYYAVARLHDPVHPSSLRQVLQEFTGEIYQRPPQRSSVKRVVRSRTIYELDLAEERGRLLLLRVLCQAGTYVRKLVYDIGEVLGPGATMVELRRTRVSHLTEQSGMVTLHELLAAVDAYRTEADEGPLRAVIHPIEATLAGLGKVIARDSAVDALCHGAQLAVPGILQLSADIVKGDLVTVQTQKGELIALAEATMATTEIQQATHGIAFLTRRVIMKAGTYPRLWRSKKTVEAGVA